ncbi:MAG TPA: TetR family transcriptional regulator, partial [Jiangellaceae bacterium]|nr:TetR family transcriptional regulator [Jiangellaceae bacterium]
MFVLASVVPRVSDAHRELRREQILDAARRKFARNGFHQTSMQDILGEAQLS